MAQLLKYQTNPVPWHDQAAIANRIADLQWQINFSQIKLNRWKDQENAEWNRLKSLNKAAKAELKDLTAVFQDP